ncbi:uncharacterized mitochondrial protein AtMg00810-like [Solanum tuberosum]|uniref:uncharacterized mitochondrial protein AtMg00810-like n=1 Tax=Solanum tuberosum TaxID=4113 RepID=UPI00073A40AC|nr:PREDICTED: uncharacterized mitochondrial protein AtMg00810-like [Solanum tuberosum]
MTDLGEMMYFLGMEIKQEQNEVFICQKKYIKDILTKFRMENCEETTTPVCQKEKLSKNDEAEKVDETLYRRLVGCLMYLTATRPDILYDIQAFSLRLVARQVATFQSTLGESFSFRDFKK